MATKSSETKIKRDYHPEGSSLMSSMLETASYCWDPIQFYRWGWPNGVLYDKQEEVLYSVRDNDETVVPAGHKLGKDFVSALTILWFYMTRSPCRIVTTSVDSYQLEKVLWGELKELINTCEYKLPLVTLTAELKKLDNNGAEVGKTYCIARVARKGEGMTGHHLSYGPNGEPAVLGVFDESSGIDHETYDRLSTCVHRILVVGNPYECTNFFRYAVEGKPGTKDTGGDIPRPNGEGYLRKVIHISAMDSPNIKYAIAEIKAGLRRPEPLLVYSEEQPWGVYTQTEYEYLMQRWNQ